MPDARPSQIKFVPVLDDKMCLTTELIIYLQGYKRNPTEGSVWAHKALCYMKQMI